MRLIWSKFARQRDDALEFEREFDDGPRVQFAITMAALYAPAGTFGNHKFHDNFKDGNRYDR